MGDGITDLSKRGLPWENPPRMDGRCDACGGKLPTIGVAWSGPKDSRFKWHLNCAPEWFKNTLKVTKYEIS